MRHPRKRPAIQADRPSNEELQGTIERVRFVSAANGWSVLEIRTDAGSTATAVGTAPGAVAGERIRCRGRWATDPKFGHQFRAEQIITMPPATTEAIEKYLASGVIAGVGRHYAQKLVKYFGTELPNVLEKNPVFLESVDGIGPERRRRIEESWRQQRNVRDIMLFLHQHGIGAHRAAQIHRRYGANAVNVLRENPYRLADELAGIGFTTADEIARRLGVTSEDPKRIEAALRATLHQQRLEGHCAMAEPKLIERTAKLLELDRSVVAAGVTQSVEARRLLREPVSGEALIYTPRLRSAEVAVAAHVQRLQSGPLPWGAPNAERAIDAAERRAGITLSPSQYQAIRELLDHKICIVTGGPGSGKTMLTRVLLSLLAARVPAIALCAPTGRAARRLKDSTGQDAMTIHRLLMGAPGARVFGRNADHPLDAQVLLVDEASMVDLELMHALLEATPDACALVLVGDADQLPSVGPGQVLNDLMDSGSVHTVRLTEIHRQAAGSRIIQNAYRVNRRLPPSSGEDPDEDFHWFIENDPGAIPERLTDLVCRELPLRYGFDPLREVQVLTPMRRGELGTVLLNQALQRRLNPNPADVLALGELRFAAGDRVVQQANNYERGVYNGDTGTIVRIDQTDKTLVVDFDGQRVTYEFSQIDDLMLAYALTVHKAQGSEYPAVVIPIAMAHYPLLSKRLLYTAISRGQRRVVLLGEEKALQIALASTRNGERTTGLCERLKGAAA